MNNYVLFGPGKKDPSKIINLEKNILFYIIEKKNFEDLEKTFTASIPLIIVTRNIYSIPKEIIYQSKLVYCGQNYNFSTLANRHIIQAYYSKLDYIKTFIGN